MVISLQTVAITKHFTTIDVSDGLSDNSVRCITQDKYGFIWIGTLDGLCRYDGTEVSIYRHERTDPNSLSGNRIQSLQAANDGLWIGSTKGVDFYSFSTNKFITCHRTRPIDGDKTIGPTKDICAIGNNVYINNQAGELFYRRSNQLFEKLSFGKSSTRCYSITAFIKGLIIARANDGLYIIDPLRRKIISFLPERTLITDLSIYYQPHTSLLYVAYGLGHEGSIYKIENNYTITPLRHPNVPRNLRTVTAYHGKTLFGTDGQGILYQENGKWNSYTMNNSNISSNVIYTYYVDRDDNLWIGTRNGGLNFYSRNYNLFECLSIANKKLSYNLINAIYPEHNILYIGTDGGGLIVYDKMTNRQRIFNTNNSKLPGNNVLSLYKEGDYLWLGIFGYGLCRFSLIDNSVKTYCQPNEGFNTNHIVQIKSDGHGRIWTCGESNNVFDKRTETFLSPTSLRGKNINSIAFDGDIAWVCTTESGLFKMNISSFNILARYSEDTPNIRLGSIPMSYVFVDSRHRIWVSAEYSGLYMIDDKNGTVQSFDMKDGLTNQKITSILEDSHGCLWLGSYNGLFRYDPYFQSFIRFGEEDNLPPFQYNYNACSSYDGMMYFGTTKGLVCFHPDQVITNIHRKPVYITGIELINSQDNNYIEIPFGGSNEIQLRYDQNFFTIHYSIPEMVAGKKILFSCYLEGLDKGWRETFHERQVSYTNVPPGRYTFHIRSTDNQGRWITSPKCIEIIISPPWYHTTLAWVIWILLLALFLYGIFYFIRHEINIKQLVRLKEIEEQTTKKVNEAKLNFFTNITHELRTPIFLITAPIEELLSSGKTTLQVPSSYLAAIYRNALRLTKLVSRIIDFRKLESGHLRLERQHLNVVSFCKELTIDYESLCMQKGIIFTFKTDHTNIELSFDPDKLESIISNLVSNAFKYTPEGGKIIFSIQETETMVSFSIEDNGIGIDKQYHEAIFENFFQIDPTKTSYAGDGIGLSFVKKLITLHGGSIRLESEPNKGSKFIFEIPKLQEDKENKVEISPLLSHVSQKSKKIGTNNPVQTPTACLSILIIDDEKETVEVIERSLINDFHIYKAYNGLDGYNIMNEYLPDIVICDLMMPKMDGIEFLKQVKKDKKLSHIPVIVFTAKTAEEDMLKAFDSGAIAYLTKPISLKLLKKRIDSILSQPESSDMAKGITKSQSNYTKEEQKFLLQCREIIDDHLSNSDFSIQFFAKKLGMSHSSLYKKIKSITGMSTIDFVNDYRIFKAVQFMEEGETNIGAISLKCGFNDIHTFREAFKKRMKMTPREFRYQL